MRKIAAFAGLTLLGFLLAGLVAWPLLGEGGRPTAGGNIAGLLVGVLAVVGASWFCVRRFDRRPLSAVGIGLDRPWLKHLGWGSAAGVGLFSLCLAGYTGARLASVRLNPELAGQGRDVLIGALFCLLFAGWEELVCRGYAFQAVARRNLSLAVLLSGLVFIAMHLTNPGVYHPLVLANLFLGHVWFAVSYLRTRSLWLPIGLHAGWNFAQYFLFGIVESQVGLSANLLITDWDRTLWTGNEFGPEGGVAVTLVVGAAIVVVWRWVKQQRPQHDLLARDAAGGPLSPATSE